MEIEYESREYYKLTTFLETRWRAILPADVRLRDHLYEKARKFVRPLRSETWSHEERDVLDEAISAMETFV